MHWYLLPFSFLYGTIVTIRNIFFDWGWIKSTKFDLPVISIGNITVGGTGKTPHIEYLLSLLNNYTTCTISRGYKRKTKGFLEVSTQSKVSDVGDEPLQIKQKFNNTTVIVDEKRVHAINKVISRDKPPAVILLDDAYQHRHVTPGLNILLIDYNKPITKDYMLPVGRLRESAKNKHRANIVIVTKCPGNMTPINFRIMQKELNLFPYQKLFYTTFKYNHLVPIFKGQNSNLKSINDLKNIETLVLTGIANPKPLYQKLEDVGAQITKLAFPDHHEFKPADTNKIINSYLAINQKQKIIVCTEKDAVRLKADTIPHKLHKLPIYFLPIEVMFLNNGSLEFKKVINDYIISNAVIKA